MQSANLESNKEVSNNGIFQAAIGTALGVGAIAGTAFLGKKGFNKGKDIFNKTKKMTNSIIDDTVKSRTKNGLKDIGSTTKDILHRDTTIKDGVSDIVSKAKEHTSATADALTENMRMQGVMKPKTFETTGDIADIEGQMSFFNPNETRRKKSEVSAKKPQPSEPIIKEEPLTPPGMFETGEQESMFGALDYMEADSTASRSQKRRNRRAEVKADRM